MIFTLVPTRKIPENKELAFLKKSLENISNNQVIFLYNKDSIFDCFENAEKYIKENYIYLDEDDTLIFCHDDIILLSDSKINDKELDRLNANDNIGFLGIAGTSKLSSQAVWWREKGFLQGKAYHKADGGMFCSLYGDKLYNPLVAMDGVFLAIKVKNLRKLNLKKPDTFVGKWDFYDIYYTIQAHFLGLCNYAMDISILHYSLGFPRNEWELNKNAFIEMYKDKFPIKKN
jgi:hypothetical protein